MKKIAILNCLKANQNCSGNGCFKALNERSGGFEPYKDVDIQFTGLRPGEKLYEELSLEEELDQRRKTGNDKIFVTKPLVIDDEMVENEIKAIADLKPEEVRTFLKRLVPNYKPQ